MRRPRDPRGLLVSAFERLGEAVVVTSAEGELVHANAAARDLRADLGAVVEGVAAGDLETGAVGADGGPIPRAQLPTEITRTSGRPCTHAEIGLLTSDERVRWLRATTRRAGDDGPPFAVVSSYSIVPEPLAALGELNGHGGGDHAVISEADLAGEREALRQARELFSTAFHRAPIGMALVDPDGRWLRVNQALCDLLGYSEPELLDLRISDVTHPEDVEAQSALLREVLEGRRPGYQLDKRYLRGDGHVVWVSISVSLVSDESGQPLHLITQVLDVTERHQMERRLQHLADHDPLTGVLNRRRFEEELIRQLDRCRRYDEDAVLVMIDLDHFKDINDSFGHAAGDEVLQTVAAALLAKVRSSDVLARVGGDEFAAILVGVGPEQAATATTALAGVVRELDTVPRGTTVSVGATVMRGGDQPDTALFRADEAMYRVKAAGRDGAMVEGAASGPPTG